MTMRPSDYAVDHATVTARPVEREDLAAILAWRAAAHEAGALRTAFRLTRAQQEAWFVGLQDRNGRDRYWIVGATEEHALVGLTGIEWENGCAEIALLVDPAAQGQGLGRAAVIWVFREAFLRMRLRTVYGECYDVNPALK